MVSIWNLVLVYGRDEKENSPVLGILYVFSASQIFFPLKCGCEKQMFSKAQGLRNIHHSMVTQYLRVDTICSGKIDLFSHAYHGIVAIEMAQNMASEFSLHPNPFIVRRNHAMPIKGFF